MAESDKVISAVMKATGESYDRVSKLCSMAHEIVDECVTDDVSVVAPPLVIGRLGCPVLDRLLLRLGDGQWQLPESVDVTESELATTLMLPGKLPDSPRPRRKRAKLNPAMLPITPWSIEAPLQKNIARAKPR